MQIVSPRGQRLRVEHPDRVELARAVEAEGEPRELVAQALVNRWAHLRDAGASMPLGELVRAYSQPISPRWMPHGEHHIAAMRAAQTEAERVDLQARADRRVANAARDRFTPATLAAVAQALRGPLTIDPRVVHFARDTAERRARHPLIYLAPNGVGFYGAEQGNADRYALPKGGPSWTPAQALDDGRASTGLAFMAALLGLGAIKALSMRRARTA